MTFEEENFSLKVENKKLAEMCGWILKAQERSQSEERKLNDYREALPATVELLQNMGFRTAYTDLMDQFQREFLNSQPEQKEVRESCYQKLQVLQALLLKLDYQAKVVRSADAEKEKKLMQV